MTGSTVCGSDLHLLHGSFIEMEKGDILGHEFCGRVKEKGSRVTNLNVGDRVVASFQIGCGECMYCKKKLSSQCEKTNSNSIEYAMYGMYNVTDVCSLKIYLTNDRWSHCRHVRLLALHRR